MEIITERQLIRQVLEKWEDVFCNGEFKGITEQLKKLNLNKVSARTVDKIIGNNTWTTVMCDGCGKNVRKAISFDKTGVVVILCFSCLKKAYRKYTSLTNHKIKR